LRKAVAGAPGCRQQLYFPNQFRQNYLQLMPHSQAVMPALP
jgi:hypothetical protein